MAIYTLEMAKKILQVEEDFDDEIVQLYLDIAENEIKQQTGFTTYADDDLDAKSYVRMSILSQFNNANGYNKEYDFIHGMNACLTRLSAKALLEE